MTSILDFQNPFPYKGKVAVNSGDAVVGKVVKSPGSRTRTAHALLARIRSLMSSVDGDIELDMEDEHVAKLGAFTGLVFKVAERHYKCSYCPKRMIPGDWYFNAFEGRACVKCVEKFVRDIRRQSKELKKLRRPRQGQPA